MFITHIGFESPIARVANTLTSKHWSAVELAFNLSWFMIKIQRVDPMDNSVVHDTLLIDSMETVVDADRKLSSLFNRR